MEYLTNTIYLKMQNFHFNTGRETPQQTIAVLLTFPRQDPDICGVSNVELSTATLFYVISF